MPAAAVRRGIKIKVKFYHQQPTYSFLPHGQFGKLQRPPYFIPLMQLRQTLEHSSVICNQETKMNIERKQ